MRLTSFLLLLPWLTLTAGICAADETGDSKTAQPDKLAEIAAHFNEMFVRGKAVACVIGDAENNGTSTYYYPNPYRREADGSYTANAVYSVVTRRAGQKPSMEQGEHTERLRLEAGKPVFEFVYPNRTSTPEDIAVHGNGITITHRKAVQGDIRQMEWLRQRDGSIVGIQRYEGLEGVVDWKEVEVPPELQQITMALDR